MPERIQYICLSDLHLGAASSLLTSTHAGGPRRASRALKQLAHCLRLLASRHSHSKKRPTLILHGDALEMALSNVEDALSVFHDFLSALFPEGEQDVFDRQIHYLPGNHDHHIWEIAREETFAHLLKKGHVRTMQSFHTIGPLSEDGLSCALFPAALNRSLSRLSIRVHYPNLCITSKDRTVVIHHGHFTERIYYQISQLRDLIFPHRSAPRTVEAIEAENFAWIDFLWSTLGRSGAAGQDLELLYEKAQDEGEIEKLIYRFAVNVTAKNHPPSVLDRIKGIFVYLLIRTAERTLIGTEVRQTKTPLSRSSWKTLIRYMTGPVRTQIEENALARPSTSFLFGHTHKPFSESLPMDGYDGEVRVLNSGGWVIETPTPVRAVGADIIVIDEALKLHALPVFRDGSPAHRGMQDGSPHADFAATLALPDWENLRSLIHEAIHTRRERLIRHIQSDGTLVARVKLWTGRKRWKSASRKK